MFITRHCPYWRSTEPNASKDNTKYTFFTYNNNLRQKCNDRLVKIGLDEAIFVNEYVYRNDIKRKLSFLHLKKHIPPTNILDNINMPLLLYLPAYIPVFGGPQGCVYPSF